MYDKIKRRLEQRVNAGPHVRIERMTTGDTFSERATSLLSAHVTSELESRMSEMFDDRDAPEAAAQPRGAVREFGGLRTRSQLETHFMERVSVDIGSMNRAFDFTVPMGSRVVGPPYDLDWMEGQGLFQNRAVRMARYLPFPRLMAFPQRGSAST